MMDDINPLNSRFRKISYGKTTAAAAVVTATNYGTYIRFTVGYYFQ